MRTATAVLLLLLNAPAGEDPAALRAQVMDPIFAEKSRVKAARDLLKADPEMLGGALHEMGEKAKNPANLPFLAAYAVQEEARHLRLVATWAAWMSAPEQAASVFLERADAEDEKEVCRAVEAAGFILGVQKDKSGSAWGKILRVAKGERTQAGIEAARALNRSMDRRLLKDVVEAACATKDNHVRKHLVWVVLDFEDGEKPATKVFESQRGKPGDAGTNAAECAQILMDKQAVPHVWKTDALRDVGTWWATGRPKGLQPDVAIKDEDTKKKIAAWLAEMKKEAPAWEHYARSMLHRIAYRADKGFEVFTMKKLTMNIESSEVLRCESDWQGAYVLARSAGIAFSAQFGEPSRDHRGWEPAYVDLHSFMKTTKRMPSKLKEFVEEALLKKPWP